MDSLPDSLSSSAHPSTISFLPGHQRNVSHDSAIDNDESDTLSTETLDERWYHHEEGHGQTYHTYHGGKYWLPSNADEMAREEVIHRAIKVVLNGRHHCAPLVRPLRIIDFGTGAGLWAMEVADAEPGCMVKGTDICPLQPNLVPPNCEFELSDADDRWSFTTGYDFVHTRCMNDYTLQDWPRFFDQAHHLLRTSGWLEMQEIDYYPHDDDGVVERYPALLEWASEWQRGLQTSGREGRCDPRRVREQLAHAGFINVEIEEYKVPVGSWMSESKLRQVGEELQWRLSQSLEGMSIKCLREHLEYSDAQFQELMARCRQELEREDGKLWFPLYVITGQKQGSG